ncbi:MAG: VapC toxin family PIN domain ribonuclease [Nocardioides sp.]|nr:VapC toxin family PIN domain ribonuclease [Nocardioides sp.]
MIVIDASVVVELLVGGAEPGLLGEDELAAPHLLDSEVAHVLRRLVARDLLTDEQGAVALNHFTELVVDRFPARPLLARVWELRHSLSAYDATYVALAEQLDAALLTSDTRLARAPGPRCEVRVV